MIETRLTNKNKTVVIRRDGPTAIIGERINPTGRKEVLAALRAGNFDVVRQDALMQVEAGAAILDVNAGVPGADEPSMLVDILREVQSVTTVPLCMDTANPKALEAALTVYEGKPLVNSVNGEEKSLSSVLPLVKEHGAAVVGLCIDGTGVPTTPEARLAVADKIIERAARIGIPLEDIVIDPLAMAMSADHNAGLVTLETIRLVQQQFDVNITIGASNISFGLPDRKYINATFIAMAIQAGLTCPITNPLVTEINAAILAADMALGRDEFSLRWIKAYRKRQNGAGTKP